jgi:hypothetical protein
LRFLFVGLNSSGAIRVREMRDSGNDGLKNTDTKRDRDLMVREDIPNGV